MSEGQKDAQFLVVALYYLCIRRLFIDSVWGH